MWKLIDILLSFLPLSFCSALCCSGLLTWCQYEPPIGCGEGNKKPANNYLNLICNANWDGDRMTGNSYRCLDTSSGRHPRRPLVDGATALLTGKWCAITFLHFCIIINLNHGNYSFCGSPDHCSFVNYYFTAYCLFLGH